MEHLDLGDGVFQARIIIVVAIGDQQQTVWLVRGVFGEGDHRIIGRDDRRIRVRSATKRQLIEDGARKTAIV